MKSTMTLLANLLLGFLLGLGLVVGGAIAQRHFLKSKLEGTELMSVYLSPDERNYVYCVKNGGRVENGIDQRPWCLINLVPAGAVEQLLPQ